MSSKQNKNNRVSQQKIKVGNVEAKIDTKIYHNFLDKCSQLSMSELQMKELMIFYETGIQLLNNYYIQCSSEQCDSSIIAKFQYTLSLINHNINIKNYNELNTRLKKNDKLTKDMSYTKGMLKDIQKMMKEITTTMISIILAISIIPTAISVLENINSNYVLPVVATVVLFGMTMILFVYLIHQTRINKSALIIYILSLTSTIILWLLTWKIDISFKPR